MKIIEIRQNSAGQEVAYLFDERSGKVIKTLVEDYTGIPLEDYQDEVRPAPMPTYPRPRRPRPPVQDEYEEDTVQRPPQKTKPSIMPPGLAGVFKPAGSPGAAEELRVA